MCIQLVWATLLPLNTMIFSSNLLLLLEIRDIFIHKSWQFLSVFFPQCFYSMTKKTQTFSQTLISIYYIYITGYTFFTDILYILQNAGCGFRVFEEWISGLFMQHVADWRDGWPDVNTEYQWHKHNTGLFLEIILRLSDLRQMGM